ncbi:Transforming growth factor beta regulator [Trichinella spiralis]|uniref:Transforming growth factor beta regulator n=1 Tax=Trichinella spiralis TaxID=6334 RepID=A0ABR3K7X4_TRISP
MQFTILIIALSVLCYGNALPSRPYWDHTAKPPVKSTPNVICDACAEHDYNCLVICKENALKIKGQDQHSPSDKPSTEIDQSTAHSCNCNSGNV